MWEVGLAHKLDVGPIVSLAMEYADYVSPYVLNPKQVEAYIDEWLVAIDSEGEIGGAMHFVSNTDFLKSAKIHERNRAYLMYLKQVPITLVNKFFSTEGAVFLSQPTCPGKGSLRAIVDYLKDNNEQLWCWLSIVSPVFSFYEEQLGFTFGGREYTFMNVYKGDYSTFRLGRWKKEG